MVYYIYLVVDNYSRKILSWRVSEKESGAIRMQTLKEAWEQAPEADTELNIDLIVDGGPENVNHVVDTFVNSEGLNIHKKIALGVSLDAMLGTDAQPKDAELAALMLRALELPESDRAALKRVVAGLLAARNSFNAKSLGCSISV